MAYRPFRLTRASIIRLAHDWLKPLLLFSLLCVPYTAARAETPCSGDPYDSIEGRTGTPAYPMKSFRAAVLLRAGSPGLGVELAFPAGQRLTLRTGVSALSYATVLEHSGQPLDLSLAFHSALASLDWYPTHHAFRLSPDLVFAESSRVSVNATLKPDQTIVLNGATYENDPANPLQGGGSVELPRIAPGLTVGLGRTVPRHGKRVSFPFDLGFAYIGDRPLRVHFTGSACDARLPRGDRCRPIADDPYYARDLSAFIAKYQPRVDRASFYPTLSTGISIAF